MSELSWQEKRQQNIIVDEFSVFDLPNNIINAMLRNQVLQENPLDLRVFEKNVFATQKQGGFDWDKTEMGNDYWMESICNQNLDIFYAHSQEKGFVQLLDITHPENEIRIINEITESLSDYVPSGDIAKFPKEIIEKMLYHQIEQGCTLELYPFEEFKESGKADGGFNWEDSLEGEDFWNSVVRQEQFEEFFAHYPVQKYSNDHLPNRGI